EGSEFTITNDFADDGDEGASTWATVLVALILVGAMFLCACCVICFITRREADKMRTRREERVRRSPPRKAANLSAVEEERGDLHVLGKSE
ncbi:unnamed protein product, partial [Scytosiphon promiscuus]